MGSICGKSFKEELYRELDNLMTSQKIKEEKKKFLSHWIEEIYTKEMEDFSADDKNQIIENLRKVAISN